MTDSLIGYRAYQLDFSLTRVGLRGARKPWDAAEMVAVCDYSKLSLAECHVADYAAHCHDPETRAMYLRAGYAHTNIPQNPSCGIYSYKSMLDCWTAAKEWAGSWLLVAEVENFGEMVVETERGYRASQTRIRELFYLPPDGADTETTMIVTRSLARKYGVPVSATAPHIMLQSDPAYVDWVGRQQVEATAYVLNARPLPFGGHGTLAGQYHHAYINAQNNYIYGTQQGTYTWQTLGNQFVLTPTSLTPGSIPSGLSGGKWSFQPLSAPLPSPSRRERFLDWFLLDSPLWVVPASICGATAPVVCFIAAAVAVFS